jgi:hypothetical protein
MRRVVAVLLGMFLPVLGLATAGLAQSAVSIQGTIQAVDCQNGTVVLDGANGSNTLTATGATAVVVNSASASFCTLAQYEGDQATAWVVPSGNEFQVTRLDVVGPVTATAQPAPASAVKAPSTLTLVLGALAVGALGYILGHQSASQAQPTYDPPAYQPGYYHPGYYQPAYQYSGGHRAPNYGSRTYQQCVRNGGRWLQNQMCSAGKIPGEK